MDEPLQPLPPAFQEAFEAMGLASGPLRGRPLAGGVASDIWAVEVGARFYCAKRALPKLRVAADWRAPIERNLYEARYMAVAQCAAPGSVPVLHGQHAALGVLVMGWLNPATHPLWKQQLRDGRADAATAAAVGDTLGRIHAYAAARPELAAQFDTDEIFFDIRLEPYLLATAERYPNLADVLGDLVAQTQAHKHSLVHGDVSPKNILIDPSGRPVLLDAECAWWGDPAFDLAFCLNHLLLKCLWTPSAREGFGRCFDALAAGYLARVDWESPPALESRAAALLPGLLLARVDGKSPVEYLGSEAQREPVRRCACGLLQAQRGRSPVGASSLQPQLSPAPTLAAVRAAWFDELTR
jgi:fructosamine-3-kinase